MVFSQLKDYNLVLASKSPRRQELLRGMDLEFSILTKETDESFPETMPPFEVAPYLSKIKAEAFETRELPENFLLITADTVVIVGSVTLNKAANSSEAIAMLRLLSGKTHTVVTGICLRSAKQMRVFSDHTEVHFATLDEAEMAYYAEKYRPFDKAGAYGIQEWIGYCGITGIRGSYYNVMGLPTQRLFDELKKFLDDEQVNY